MSVINPCNVSAIATNTGSECSNNLKASAMLFLGLRSLEIPSSALTGIGALTAWLQIQIHADPSVRIYPLFGTAAPIRVIEDTKEGDVIETLDDGSKQFIRFGMFERMFSTTEGGLCLAQKYGKFIGNRYGFIEVDIISQIQMQLNADGSYGFFPVNLMYSPTPELANFKTSYKNKFMMNFNPLNYIGKGKVFANDGTEDFLSLRGLYDVDVAKATTTQTTTNIYVTVTTDCAQTDLTALFPTALPLVANFVVALSVSPFTVVTPSAVIIVGKTVKITGTYVSESSYTVALAPASTLLTNGVIGYDGVVAAVVPIP